MTHGARFRRGGVGRGWKGISIAFVIHSVDRTYRMECDRDPSVIFNHRFPFLSSPLRVFFICSSAIHCTSGLERGRGRRYNQESDAIFLLSFGFLLDCVLGWDYNSIPAKRKINEKTETERAKLKRKNATQSKEFGAISLHGSLPRRGR